MLKHLIKSKILVNAKWQGTLFLCIYKNKNKNKNGDELP
jgi:hypothetical protein